LTKIFVARPATLQPPITPPQSYSVSLEAQALEISDPGIVEPLTYDLPSKGPYVTEGGWMFDVELYVFDTSTKLPIRAVNLKTGDKKTFTDRLGCARFNLTRGHHEILIEGLGYIETKDFVPRATKFEPIIVKLDLDSDIIFTVFSSGEVVQGERRALDNPGHHQSSELSEFLRQYWWAFGLVGLTGATFYFMGKAKAS